MKSVTFDIMLVCAAGMSTSMLVKEMKEVAERRNIDAHIYAISAQEVEEKLNAKHVDLMLLGPQVRYMKPKFEELAAEHNVKIEVINMKDYGTMNGENVLDMAIDLVH